ncbi:hypothetical protein FRC04_009736 [Tulasnella sp. 424]|nr:hypothetical protein FRC04_009736 [Tulasnella sp. 424]
MAALLRTPSKKADPSEASTKKKSPEPTSKRVKAKDGMCMSFETEWTLPDGGPAFSKAPKASSKKKDSKEPKLYSKPPKGRVVARALYLAENIHLGQGSVTERFKAVAAQWNSLSAEEKQVWVARAEETNVKRQEELEAWEAQLSPEALRQYKKDRLQRSRLRAAKKAETLGTTGLKQRGATAFMFFVQAYRKNPAEFELPVIEPACKSPAATAAKALGQVWRSMTLGEKAPYIAQAEEDSKKVKQDLANHMAEWRDKAIDYRQLKKLINQVVLELSALGLNPAVLQRFIAGPSPHTHVVSPSQPTSVESTGENSEQDYAVVYEVTPRTQGIYPQIRLRLPHKNSDSSDLPFPALQRRASSGSAESDETVSVQTTAALIPGNRSEGHLTGSLSPALPDVIDDEVSQEEVILPLSSDAAFLELLSGALAALANLYSSILKHCEVEVEALSRTISSSARPRSEGGKSDLDTWRSIFQLWVESEIFESVSERHHGEVDATEAEKRLKRFADEVIERGLDSKRAMRIVDSRDALNRFYGLNVLILDLKKFQMANAEATRKILKKHEKRTSLPSSVVLPSLALTVRGNESLPRVMLCMITETLLPVIPSIDDYSCMICTSIAFKPIRLDCGHLFCVRCLVKMQKKGTPEYGNCPLCRAPTVFKADKSNLDIALMNFMKDWFPKEVRIKARENGEEANKEMAEELGIDKDCRVM